MGSATYILAGTNDELENIETSLGDLGFGMFSVLESYSTIDENGFLIDLSTIFSFYSDETSIASVLGLLSSQQMTILNEVYAYTYTGFDESNTEITIFSSGYNGLSDPTTALSEDTFFGLFDYYTYNVTLDSSESAGLRSKFGYPAGSSAEEQIESAVTRIFKRTKRVQVNPSDFGNIDPVTIRSSTTVETATDSDTTATTNTSRSY